MARPSFTVVLETENLATAGIASALPSLESLARQTLPIEEADRVLLIDDRGMLPHGILEELRARFPWIDVHVPDAPLGHYYRLKLEGARAARSDVVVYADTDVVYAPDWLASMLAPFEDPSVGLVTGVTLNGGPGVYETSITLSWMAAHPPRGDAARPATRILANAYAGRRDVLLSHPIPDVPLYRAQMLLTTQALRRDGVVLMEHPRALGTHRSPDSFREWYWRHAVLGSDLVLLRGLRLEEGTYRIAPWWRRLEAALRQVAAVPIELSRRVARVSREFPEQRRYLVPALPIAIAGNLVRIGGGFVTVVAPRAVLRRMEALEDEAAPAGAGTVAATGSAT